MSVATLPLLSIKCGQSLPFVLFFEDADGPVDLTAWSGRFAVAEDYDQVAIVEVAPLLSAEGLVSATLTAEQTLLLQPYVTVGCPLVFQIDLAGDGQEHRLQGKVKLFPEIG